MKKILQFTAIIVVVALSYFVFTTYPKLDLISGFSAKSIASAHFIDHRPQKIIEKEDNDLDLIDLATNKIDETKKLATASVFGLKERKAIYRKGLGATLIDDDYDTTQPYLIPKRTKSNLDSSFPYGNKEPKDTLFSTIDYERLHRAVDFAFDKKGEFKKRTRSLLIIYKDKIIAEKYATGFDKNSKILGWSMTKSITATLFGILEKQRKYNIYKPVPIKAWANDNRKKITTNDLLHMNSGLEWEEDYSTISDVTKMLFQAKDMGRSQLEKPLKYTPNTHWCYSSGTTNLLSNILRQQFNTHQDYLDFWYTALIDKIGMHSMLVETDMAGNYIGSSYGWATTRDWAKFGLLYLHEGNWNGEQIFDKSWVCYTTTPTKTSNGGYGGQFWLNAGGRFPDVPREMYYAEGFQGQMIAIFPSQDLVVIRMGLKELDFNKLFQEIVESIKK